MPIELPPGSAAYSDRNPETSNSQLLILLGLCLGVVVGVVSLIVLVVMNVVLLIPPNVEQRIGAIVAPGFERLAPDSSAQLALNQLLDRLEVNLSEQQRQGRDYKVLYIPDATVNALAIPGDRIILYGGLVAQATSENELMMIMGHELGHFAHRDHLRSLGRGLGLQLSLALLLGDTSTLSKLAASGVTALSAAQFSQSQEREADEFGLTLLQKTYGQVAGATDFFARLNQKDKATIAFLATHPASGDRVQHLEQLIQQRRYQVGTPSSLPTTLQTLP